MELYQAEWCPHSHKVRQRLTKLGLDLTAHQVAADPDEREEMKRRDAAQHREKSREEIPEFAS